MVIAAISLSVGVASGPAEAAPGPPTRDVAACDGTTSSDTGTITTPPATIELTDTNTPGVGQVTDLNDGKTVFLYDNKGRIVVQPDGSYVPATGGIPLCGVRLDPNTGNTVSEWAFCTDEELSGCAELPPDPIDSNPDLTSDDVAIIAVLLAEGDTSTKRSRALLQIQIWCISEHLPAGSVHTAAANYFSFWQFTIVGVDPESAPITSDESTCRDQAYRDAAIAAVPETVALSLAGPMDPIDAPATATFLLTASIAGEVDLDAAGADSLALCPDDSSGATLSGSTLTLVAPSAVALCATRATAGIVDLTASTSVLTRSNLAWAREAGCQHFVTFSGQTMTATATASASFAVVPVDTTAAPQPPEPTTTVTRGLPATGPTAGVHPAVIIALIMVGCALLWMVRRPTARGDGQAGGQQYR